MLKLIHKTDESFAAPEIATEPEPLPTGDIASHEPLIALLCCRDHNAQRWARRWLEQSGFEVRVATSSLEAQEILPTMDAPSIAILEAGIWERWGKHLYSSQVGGEAESRCPAIVLCAKSRQARQALSTGAADVATRPFDWQLIGRRAAVLVQSERSMAELERAHEVIDTALAAARDAREKLDQKADTDALTELPNRRVFGELLDRVLAAPRAVDSRAAVLLLDLDRFSSINESVGRDGGDAVLAIIGKRLRECLHGRELFAARASGLVSASVARIGSDEFAMMVSNVASAEHVRQVAEKILKTLSDPFEVNDGTALHVSGSLGVACYPGDGQNQEELLRRAELALLESKDLGGGTVSFYDQSLNHKACRRVALTRELRLALERDEFQLHFQPLIDLSSRKLVAVEALLRWHHPTDGPVPPMSFVPEAEESGLMVPIGSWVLHTACRQLRTWLDAGLPPIRMAINVAHCQLTRGDLVADIGTALAESRIPPELLELELSERGVLGRSPRIADLLKQLKTLGVRISIDDFGTGDSAIAYLKSLPIDILKIDNSFVLGAPTSADDAVIASAMVAMAHQLKLRVVAEGVESYRHVKLAREWGCDEMQGFLFSPPRPAEEFHSFIEGNKWVVPQSDEETEI